MPTTNTERRDHPAAVLDRLAAAIPVPADAAATRQAADLLRAFERTEGLTFEALDPEMLAVVKAAWASVTSGEGNGLAMADLISALGDLFGLGD